MIKRMASVSFLLLALTASALAGGVDAEHLKKYGRGIITDYGDMKASDTVEWYWVAPGVKLSEHRYKVASAENLTVLHDTKLMEALGDALPKSLERAAAKSESAPVLTVDAAIYWLQRANRAKWFIPYAGLHLAQAGVGLEVVIRNDAGEVVAKMRHSGREGDHLDAALVELIDEVAGFVRAN